MCVSVGIVDVDPWRLVPPTRTPYVTPLAKHAYEDRLVGRELTNPTTSFQIPGALQSAAVSPALRPPF
jgi:hypothetical protein